MNRVNYFAIFLVFVKAACPLFTAEIETVDDLEKKLNRTTGMERISVLLDLGLRLQEANPDKAIRLAEEALVLSRESGHDLGEARALLVKARAVIQTGKMKESLNFVEQAENKFARLRDRKGLLQTKLARAYIHFTDTDYPEALHFYFEAGKEAEAIKDSYKERIEIIKFTGIIYGRQGDLDNAFSIYQEGIHLAKKNNIQEDVALFFNQLAIIEKSRGKNTEALKYLQESKKIFSKLGLSRKATLIEMNIADTLDDPAKSLTLFKTVLIRLRELKETEYTWRTLILMGKRYRILGEFAAAEECYREALELGKNLNRKEFQQTLYGGLSGLKEETGDYAAALEWHKKYIAAWMEVVDEKKNREIARWQEKFNTEKKERENLDLRRKNQLQLILFIFGFLLVSTLLGIILKKYIYLFAFWKKEKYIGQYRILERIGAGGMGVVYKAHNIRDKSSLVAVKVLKEEHTQLASNIKRFKREGMIVDRLDHANILKVFERGEYEGRLYIVMEYLQGRTLDQVIMEEGPLSISLCLHIMTQISSALAVIHGERIVHRDLKPANIMLIEREGDPHFVKLLDFGLSKVWYHSRLTESGILVGTLSYQAPEQLQSQEFSPASDIYALGMVCYEMLTGKRSFEGDSMSTAVEKIIGADLSPLLEIRPDIPEEIRTIIMAMLKKDPKDRPKIKAITTGLKNLKNY